MTSPGASRPFDVRREGFILGEGAAILVLESEGSAVHRGARRIATVSGYGSTCDANSHFHQEESGVDAERAIRQAMFWGQVRASEVDYVNAHGTGTRENDPFEASVLRRVFGESVRTLPVSSSKSQFGHLLGACGAIEAAAVMAAMIGGYVPMTLNLDEPDPACELAHVRGQPKRHQVDVAVSVNFGFGARNAALVFRREQAR